MDAQAQRLRIAYLDRVWTASHRVMLCLTCQLRVKQATGAHDCSRQGPSDSFLLVSADREEKSVWFPLRTVDWRIVFVAFLLVSACYVWWHLRRGWIPIDDGPVAQSAERVMQGQLPHRDFDELYTGGLAFVNAAAFRILGTNLWTLRIVLFGVFLAWVPAVFYIASRFARPPIAASIGFLAVVWSLPTYSGAMASWYNLFLATLGTASLLRYLEDPRARWLFLAGLAGGLSFLVKVIGLYYIAAVLLFLVFHANAVSASSANAQARLGRGYAAFVTASLLAFVAALLLVVRSRLHVSEFVQFVIPGALLAMLLIRNEWTQPSVRSSQRLALLTGLMLPFLAGIALPVALFTARYARAGALAALVHGVFVAPQQRLAFIAVHAPGPWTMLALAPFAALVLLTYRAKGRLSRRETALLAVMLLLLLRATGGNGALYRTVWFAARTLLPVLAICGVVLLSRTGRADSSLLRREQVMLLLAVTALCSLVQFPYTVAVYFGYVAPLVPLLALALYSHVRLSARTVPALLVSFFIAFAMVRTNATRIASVGNSYHPQPALARLAMERGGIEVPTGDAATYGALVAKLRSRARGGYTWASPDSPEVYFLSGLANPTRTLFEVFDDPPSRPDQVVRMLDARGVTAIVLSAPSFSPPLSPEMYTLVSARYPHSEYVGPFQLRWRD